MGRKKLDLRSYVKSARAFAKDKHSVAQTEHYLGLSKPQVYKLGKDYKIQFTRPKRKLKHTTEKLIKMYNSNGGSYTRMARKMKLSPPSISLLMKRHNLRKKYPATNARD